MGCLLFNDQNTMYVVEFLQFLVQVLSMNPESIVNMQAVLRQDGGQR